MCVLTGELCTQAHVTDSSEWVGGIMSVLGGLGGGRIGLPMNHSGDLSATVCVCVCVCVSVKLWWKDNYKDREREKERCDKRKLERQSRREKLKGKLER